MNDVDRARRAVKTHAPTGRVGVGIALLRFAFLCALTVTLMSLIAPPISWWPLAFICLTPWAVGICRTERTWIVYWGSFLFGWIYFLINLAWLAPVTGLGFVALAFYLALYWPLAAWAVRTARRVGIEPAWSLPVVWVACEYLWGTLFTGFPWLFLAHAFYRFTTLIQIADLTGAWGVSFVVALVNGMLAELVLRWWRSGDRKARWRTVLLPIGVTLIVLAGVLYYGKMRLDEADFRDGPRVAVVQEDFPLSSTPPYSDHPYLVLARYLRMAADAAAEKPDLLVLPETAWQGYQNREFLEAERQAVPDNFAGTWAWGKKAHEATAAFARGDYQAVNAVIAFLEPRLGEGMKLPRLPATGGPPVTLVLGTVSIDMFPDQAYPKHKKFNSALVYDADGQWMQRYDKIHLVPFGEVVPFRNYRFMGMSLHWLYRTLNRLSPFSERGTVEYSLWPGDEFTVFELPMSGGPARFGIPICYEDTVPGIPRRFVWDGPRRRVDFLVNISNDGWFNYSTELEQHLAICTFRAVENRVGIARAVNTGVSGFIDPAGRAYSLVQKDGRLKGPGVVGYRVDHVKIDTRASFYGRWGDWFPLLCTLLTAALWLGGIITRWIFSLHHWIVTRRSRGVRA